VRKSNLGYLRFSPPKQNIDEYLVWDEELQAYLAPGEYPESIETESFEDFCARIDQIRREMKPPYFITMDDIRATAAAEDPSPKRKSGKTPKAPKAPQVQRDLFSDLEDD
jgi:hypothetical protein